jgi:hypothetical protein
MLQSRQTSKLNNVGHRIKKEEPVVPSRLFLNIADLIQEKINYSA